MTSYNRGMERLRAAIEKNPKIRYILRELKFPNNLEWFLIGGCVYQTVWNEVTGRNFDYGIKDYDIHYWDDDISKEKQEQIAIDLNRQLSGVDIEVEAINQARVYVWFEEAFSAKMEANFTSLRQAMTTHPFTVMCVGINNQGVHAPYGIEDVFSMTACYNPRTHIPAKHVFKKLNSWRDRWPDLNVLWESFGSDFDIK